MDMFIGLLVIAVLASIASDLNRIAKELKRANDFKEGRNVTKDNR